MIRAYAPHVPALIVRPANVYGPGGHPTTLIPELMAQARAGAPVRPRDPEAFVEPVHVDDVALALCAALALALDGPPRVQGGVFGAGGAIAVKAGRLAAFIEALRDGRAESEDPGGDGEREIPAGIGPPRVPEWQPRTRWREGVTSLWRQQGA
ncbi:MAG: NAD-dependent epimerase/dehydratase family protein [Deltaproteobacteria bacterium]|nr:NAD-dependent epimerase/dehydratase family protein [Deltaproteobacteria bacterium]